MLARWAAQARDRADDVSADRFESPQPLVDVAAAGRSARVAVHDHLEDGTGGLGGS